MTGGLARESVTLRLSSSSRRKCSPSRYSLRLHSWEIDVLILVWEFSSSEFHRVAVEHRVEAFRLYLFNVENSNELMMKIDFCALARLPSLTALTIHLMKSNNSFGVFFRSSLVRVAFFAPCRFFLWLVSMKNAEMSISKGRLKLCK